MTNTTPSPRYVVGWKDPSDDAYFAEPELDRSREQVIEALNHYLDHQEKEPDTANNRTEFSVFAQVDEALPPAPKRQPGRTTWLTTEELLAELRLSESTLHLLKDQGVLEPGEHWRRTGRTLTWDLLATELRLRQHTAEREGNK